LLAVNFERGLIESMDQSNEMKKIINAVIKKMIKEERMLMVVEDSNDLTKKMLQIHPNYVRQ
jgi:lipid A disaccharide synthetase